MSIQNLEQAKHRWLTEAKESQLGLWWIVEDVRGLMPGATEEEVRRETLTALLSLMRRGALRAAEQLDDGDFKPWEGSIDDQLARIEFEWLKLGRRPTLGDVAWFIAGSPDAIGKPSPNQS